MREVELLGNVNFTESFIELLSICPNAKTHLVVTAAQYACVSNV